MKMYDFVFSNKSSIRVLRHGLFWFVRLLQYYFHELSINLFMPGATPSEDYGTLLYFTPTVISLGIDIIYCYIVVYLFLPLYFNKKKYFMFGLFVSILTIIAFSSKAVFDIWITRDFGKGMGVILTDLWYEGIAFLNSGVLVICGLFCAIKMLKLWFQKERQKLELIKESSETEIQLLKAQVHPHFLFNTLNNIYSFALNQSPKAETLVQSLSGIISYMANDCNAEQIELGKEIQILKDYFELEKVRYGNKLTIITNIEGDYGNKMITPLLMLPFVENAFKHGASKLLSDPLIKLHIKVDDNTMHFFLSNKKPPHPVTSNSKSGIGLQNVQKRLSLLFPEKHSLKIETTDDMFIVNMVVPISIMKLQDELHSAANIISDTQNISYER